MKEMCMKYNINEENVSWKDKLQIRRYTEITSDW